MRAACSYLVGREVNAACCYTLHPAAYMLHATSCYTLHPASYMLPAICCYNLHAASYMLLHFTSMHATCCCTLHPASYMLPVTCCYILHLTPPYGVCGVSHIVSIADIAEQADGRNVTVRIEAGGQYTRHWRLRELA